MLSRWDWDEGSIQAMARGRARIELRAAVRKNERKHGADIVVLAVQTTSGRHLLSTLIGRTLCPSSAVGRSWARSVWRVAEYDNNLPSESHDATPAFQQPDLLIMDSPFKDILNTNTVPSDAECQNIHDFLKDPRRQCADLNEQIARMQKPLADLTRDRGELQSFIDAARRRRTRDIRRSASIAQCIISATEPPLLLCNIWRPWRALALSTPQLWASGHIVVPSSSQMERTTSMVDTFSRSGVLPLSLSVVLSRSSDRDTDVSMLLETLIRLSSRWKKIHFTLPYFHSFGPLSKVAPEHLSVLENVYVQVERGNFEETFQSMFAFLGAPNLRSASLCPQLSHTSVPLRWELLRHLTISNNTAAYITTATALEILYHCVRLESCLLTVWSGGTGQTLLNEEPCRIEHLQRLCVKAGGDYFGLVQFFSRLVLPNLRVLVVENPGSVSLAFGPMLSSARLVESLTTCITASITGLVDVLQLMPMLQDLRLINPDANNVDGLPELIALLTDTAGDSPVLCPRLRRIALKNAAILSDSALLKFIQARTGSHLRDIAHLATVRVEFLRAMEFDILPPLRELLAAGLKVTLDYKPYPRPTYSPSDSLELLGADFANARPVEW
ncbi:hypothetical protein C8J57DRAFT_1616042 [Mycena rebaudengoi]|nr:hypothetical protein C8J57DRAFT_1616042 [Mycena rebaudengoi]